MALIIIAIILWLLILSHKVKSNLKSRKTPNLSGYQVIQYRKLSFSWLLELFWLFILSIALFFGTFSKEDIGDWLIVLVASEALLSTLISIGFQKYLQPNRIMYNENEIVFLGDKKIVLQLDSIKSISLNGITDLINLQGNTYLSFKRYLISESDFNNLMSFIDQKKGLENIEISDNLMPEVKKIIEKNNFLFPG